MHLARKLSTSTGSLVAALTLGVAASACGSTEANPAAKPASTQVPAPSAMPTPSTATAAATPTVASTTTVSSTAAKSTAKVAASSPAKAAATPRPAVTRIPGSKRSGSDLDFSKQAPFTGQAANVFGAKRVMAAYKETVDFTFDHGFTNLMGKAPRNTYPGDFGDVQPYMTPATYKWWDAAVKKAIKGDRKSKSSVQALMSWNLSSADFKIPNNDPMWINAYGGVFSPATTSVSKLPDGTKSLNIRFSVTQSVRGIVKGKTVAYPATRDITYGLVPNPNKKAVKSIPWLISGWTATVKFGKVIPDPLAGLK
jgi:hypothetical protein